MIAQLDEHHELDDQRRGKNDEQRDAIGPTKYRIWRFGDYPIRWFQYFGAEALPPE
jgi:hypothetical protein